MTENFNINPVNYSFGFYFFHLYFPHPTRHIALNSPLCVVKNLQTNKKMCLRRISSLELTTTKDENNRRRLRHIVYIYIYVCTRTYKSSEKKMKNLKKKKVKYKRPERKTQQTQRVRCGRNSKEGCGRNSKEQQHH